MPRIDPGTQNTNQVPKARAKAKPAAKPVKVRVTVPDAGDSTRTTQPHPVTPDQADRQRGPVQQATDATVVTRNVRVSREKALGKQGRGSGTRAVKAWAKSNVADAKKFAGTDAQGHHAGSPFAMILANAPGPGGVSLKILKNAGKDAAELAVTTPSSIAKLGSDIVHHPGRVPGELAAPYVDLAKHPVKNATEKPVSTALEVQPFVKVPGRVLGRVARLKGAQTLERAPATLPGTALKEARTGSRDVAMRARQAKKDAAEPAPTVTAKQVQHRVDAHFDFAKHESHRIVGEHVKAARKATKGQPKPVRQAAVEAAREHGQHVANDIATERFAREFGANVRLSHGVAAREATHTVRRRAVKVLDAAKTAAKQAEDTHKTAWTDLRAARNAARNSPQLRALEFTRRDAQRNLVDAQRAHGTARAEYAKAVGRAQVLHRNVTGKEGPGPGGRWAAGGHGVQVAKQAMDAAAKTVQDTRARLRDLDQRIADEHARPLPPLHPARQAFTDAIQARGAARVALAQAKTDAHAAAHAHITAKQAMTNATLVSPAKEGRLFAHKADAATVVKKLNQAATDPAATFVLRQVGGDRWAAVPKVATQRLLKHQVVGTSPATMAKVMRVSRGAFTNAVLPLSAKWLAGQGVEAGVRSVVAGAGPMDWLRMGKVVKKLNAQKAGSGDALAMRVSGGHFDLTGPARDFANGKSLADEFADTPLSKPANAASAVGRTAPVRAIKHGWGQYTRAVLGGINHAIEQNARRAMAGQAIKDLGFQDQHIVGLFDKAIDDAANSLKGTHNQVALTRAVNRMYGKYQGFSPEVRTLLLHWSPFAPWYLNSAKFLLKTLPVDHPLKAALVADASAVEKDWRESHGMSLQGSHVPDFLLGSYPLGGGKSLPLAHYTPFGVGTNIAGSAADLMLPQFLGPLKNAGGVDWKWDPLTHGGSHGKKFNQGERLIRAAVTAAEEQVPLVSQAGKVSGITPRFVDKNSPDTIKSPGAVLKGYLPTTPTSGGSAASSGGSSGSSARVKIPGAGTSGRVRLPGGGTARVKIP